MAAASLVVKPSADGSNMLVGCMTNLFEPAIAEMRRDGSKSFGPMSFRGYLKQHNLPNKDTATAISIDSLSKLSKDLVEANAMVFRLGNDSRTNHTAFALAHNRVGWSDFFLEDHRLFSSLRVRDFAITHSQQDLSAFRFLPKLTEPSLVNLALASGLLGEALELDDPTVPIVPATGQSTYTFDVRPFEEGPDWTHRQGQVEIDSLFFAKRNGERLVFLVEAKRSNAFDSLAKHKLVYPYLALRTGLPTSTPIIPVYLRAVRNGDSWNFFVCECAFENAVMLSVSGLKATDKLCAFRVGF